ncbi:MAG: signal transduction histidine kinase [Clostridiaceae bacterium]|nr:signal transduction histidine kinase [Clostridiaceae bacterium]
MIALLNKFKLAFTQNLDEIGLSKSPIIVGILLVYLSTDILSSHAIIGLTIVMTIQLLIYLFSDIIFKRKYWLYFGIQGIIIFDYAIIMSKGYEPIFIGLIPVLIFQSIMVYYDTIKVIITSVFFYSIFCGTIIIFDGVKELTKYIPILILITIAVRAYSTIFLKQVKLRIQTQKILKELEFAYEKVEELTLINERQRMARDLHDTLSQGIAGIVMQLEAINANLNNNNAKRAQEIVQKSMEHARKTLSDSRLVIDDLRFEANNDMDFAKAIENEIAEFRAVTSTSISADIRIESQIPLKILKHILYIVREALNNIAKHAKAKKAVVEIIEAHNEININIKDDGIGFDVKLLDKLFGHYGMLGMTERVKAIQGKIKIESKRKSGTNINITIPIEKGIYDENE